MFSHKTTYESCKEKEFQDLEKYIRTMRTYNGQIFIGGYTEHARDSYNAREKQIALEEQQKKEELNTKWNGSEESRKKFKKQLKEEQQKLLFKQYTGANGPGIPQVGGYAATHAVSHGGGFNHPGVYAGGVFW